MLGNRFPNEMSENEQITSVAIEWTTVNIYLAAIEVF